MLLGLINYFVYLFRQNEIIFSDIRSVGTGISVAGQYQIRLHEKGLYAILATVLFVLFASRLEIAFKKRLQMSVINVLLITACVTVVAWNCLYINCETWEQKGSYRNGFVLNFILSIRDSIVEKPDGYSKDAIAALEEEYVSPTKEYAKCDVEDPTIIVIMSESFSDLSVLGPLNTNKELTPFIDSLSENTVKGYALSSVFGAKTPNSEWEYLSGHSMAFLPGGSVVYQQYISDTPTTLVSSLKNMGYTCVAMHPYYATGWSRNLVYPNIGYDEMYFIDHFDQKQVLRKYITDEEMYKKIIERYENRRSSEKLFLMSISMQNHGGYTEKYSNFTEDVVKLGASYEDANQYLSLVHTSDRQLEDFLSYFAQVEDPVEIVFFGDHQPSLTAAFYPLLNGKGMTGLTLEEQEALYTVPFFIWTNYDSPSEEVEITSLNYLSTMTLERAGLALPTYNQFMADLQEEIPAINAHGYWSKEDKAYKEITEATGKEAEWILKYQNLQYNEMFDRKNSSHLFFPYIQK